MSVTSIILEKSKIININDELVNILKKYGNNHKQWPALHYAVECQDDHAVEILLKNGANPNELAPLSKDARNNPSQFHTPLYIATQLDFTQPSKIKTSMVKLLLDYGADPCIFEYQYTSVNRIINLYTGSIQNIKNERMIEESLDLNKKSIEILNMLADKKIDFNKFCFERKDSATIVYPEKITPLRLAVQSQDDFLIKFLLNNGARLDGV